MITVEKYSFKDGQRYVDKVEYSDVDEFEREILLEKISGNLIGYKQYDISLSEYKSMSQVKRDTLPCVSKFDKEAFLKTSSFSGSSLVKDLHRRLAARGVVK